MITENLGRFYTNKCPTREFVYVYHIEYSQRLNADGIYFRIFQENDLYKERDHFSYILRVMENGMDLKVIDLYANRYSGCGISKFIIIKSKELFGKRIISSSNKFPSFLGESNWKDAINKVWDPMVLSGLAMYDESGDFYFLL